MNALRNTVRWASMAVLAALLVSCNSSDSSDGPAGEMASASIGPAGGTVAFADERLTLVIPPGALASATQITITDLPAASVPENLKPVEAEKVYRLEPAGTRFAVPARLTAKLAASPTGDLAVLLLESNGVIEASANLEMVIAAEGRQLSGDISHFSHATVKQLFGRLTATISANPDPVDVGRDVEIKADLQIDAPPEAALGYKGISLDMPSGFVVAERDDVELIQEFVVPQGGKRVVAGKVIATCVVPGNGVAEYEFEISGFLSIKSDLSLVLFSVSVPVATSVTCKGTEPDKFILFPGLYALPGLTAPDGVSAFPGPFANLSGAGPYGVFAGAEGVKVLDLVTRQVVLDRTATGPDGATLGTDVLGVVPVAQAASAGAPAAFVSFSARRALVHNWDAIGGWGGDPPDDAEPTFDAVTAGGGLVANSVLLVRPVGGIDILSYDSDLVWRVDPARGAPLSAFPAGGQLVSAYWHDVAWGGVLALSRATTAGTSTSSKVFFKNVDDAQPAATLLSWGNVDTRRLRCIPVGAKQACVATLFGGEGRAFLFDPASPRDTPRVTTLVAAAGTLGVALSALPNGRIVVVMANFTANSLTVAELSADLVTVHSLETIPAPTGCTGTAHPALVTDSEGMKAVVTCNGTNNYWVAKLP